MAKIKLTSNIKIPDKPKPRGNGIVKGDLKKYVILKTMKAGQSFHLPYPSEGEKTKHYWRLYHATRNYGRVAKKTFEVRHWRNGVRVWRVRYKP